MILVTGATGFIGEQLTRRLLTLGEPVRVLARTPAKVGAVFGPLAAHLDVAPGELGDRASLRRAVEGVDRVYHCASWIAYKAPWDQVWQVNVQGAVNLLDACLDAGVRRVVHMSSIAAGGPAVALPGGGWRSRTEDDPPAPLNDPYGLSKRQQEDVVLAYNGQGLEAVVVRPGAVFGPGDPAGINTLLKLIVRRQLPFYLGARETPVNVVPVKDVVAGCVAAMERGRPGGVYNLVGPDVSQQELFALLAEVSGGRAPSWSMPVPVLLGLAHLVAAVARRKPPVHPNDIRSWTAPWAASGEKARTELGLEPSDLREAWAETLTYLTRV
ncbi:MAG TPA: SDR family NAD(P)-dependent oxidoreductase [Symbiobacteriaceae bacterium]|nr:SDR family NAD(P)-dependent oxidoreductase [Symbiobacteriaceae bacterium]